MNKPLSSGIGAVAFVLLALASSANDTSVALGTVPGGVSSLLFLARLTLEPSLYTQYAADLENELHARDASVDLSQVSQRAGLPLQLGTNSLTEIKKHGGTAILHLRDPEELVALQTMGTDSAYVSNKLMSLGTLKARYTGQAFVPVQPFAGDAPVSVDNSVGKVFSRAAGETVTCNFQIRNAGTRALPVAVAETSCGCTSATLSATSIAPKASIVASVSMVTGKQAQKIETVRLKIGNATQPSLLLVLQALKPVIPSKYVLLMKSEEGKAATSAFEVSLPAEATIAGIRNSHSYIKPRFVGDPKTPNGKAGRIEVTLLPSAPAGAIADKIEIRLRNAGVASISVPLEGYVSPDIQTEPKQLSIAEGAVNGNKILRVVLQSRNKRSFKIKTVECVDPRVKIQRAEVSGDSAQFDISVVPVLKKNPEIACDIVFWLTDERKVILPVSGRITGAQEDCGCSTK